MNTKPQSTREPWRIVKTDSGTFEIWTRYDDTPGSRNYVIAADIQDEREANRICKAVNRDHAFEALLEVARMAASSIAIEPIALMDAARAAIKSAEPFTH